MAAALVLTSVGASSTTVHAVPSDEYSVSPVSATDGDVESSTVSWVVPDGKVRSYQVMMSKDGAPFEWVTAVRAPSANAGEAASTTVTGLEGGVTVQFLVRAWIGPGPDVGPWSRSPVVTPAPNRVDHPDLPSGIDPAPWLATGERIPQSMAWEPSGGTGTVCSFSHMAYDDPIIYPGQPGASHLHMFFGNTETDANSTYESLRTSGDGTCLGGPLNRTAYWMPAMFNADDKVVIPGSVDAYYTGNGSLEMLQNVTTFPNGLQMIAGWNKPGDIPDSGWSCNLGPKTRTIPSCPEGGTLMVELRFPACWDGENLTAPDHRSHTAYGTGGGGWITQQAGCPETHPVQIPSVKWFAFWTSDGNTENWYLASDRMEGMPERPSGSTFHADWFGAWENDIQETLVQECIRETRRCVFGELGDGTRLQNRSVTYQGPTVVDPPPRR